MAGKHVAGAILKGVGAGAKTYARGKLDQANERAKRKQEEDKRKLKAQDEAVKEAEALKRQLAFHRSLDDPRYDYLADLAEKNGFALENTQIKTALENYAAMTEEGDSFMEELQSLVGEPSGGQAGSIDYSPFAMHEGIGPGSLATEGGRRQATASLIDYKRYLPSSSGMADPLLMQIPGATDEVINRVAEQREKQEYEGALKKALREKRVKAQVYGEEQTPEDRGIKAGRAAIAKKDYVGEHTKPKQKKLSTTERNAIVKDERNEILLQVGKLYGGLDGETKNKIGVQQVFTTADLKKLISSQEKGLTGKGTDFGFFSGSGDEEQQAIHQQILDLAKQYRLVGSREWWRNREQSTELDDINAELERLDALLQQ